MKLILIPLITILLCQTAKLLWRLATNRQGLTNNPLWVFVYATGAPSAHSAILVSALYSLYLETGLSAMFVFACVVAVILMYNLVADRRREEIEEEFFKDGDEADKLIVKTGRVMDISGHTFFDIATGVIFGLVSAVILTHVL